MLKKIATLIILYSVVLLTACPSKASLEKAKAESSRIAGYANAGVNLTRSLYESQVITIGQKDNIARKFISLADAGIAFDLAVNKAIQTYGSNVPKSEIERVFAVFDSEVVEKFLDILSSMKLLANKAAYAQVIDTLRTAVLLVAKVFNKRQLIAAKVQLAG